MEDRYNKLFLSSFALMLLPFLACTSKSLEVGDCVVDPEARQADELIRITQTVDNGYFGARYFNGEPTGEISDLDPTVEYVKVTCPD